MIIIENPVQVLLGGLNLLIANWVRVASISPNLSPDGKFAIMMLSQIFVALAQACCQIITVRYSELWFDVRGRVVATMLTNICELQSHTHPQLYCPMLMSTQANPLGGAIASLVLPQTPTVNWAVSSNQITLAHPRPNSCRF